MNKVEQYLASTAAVHCARHVKFHFVLRRFRETAKSDYCFHVGPSVHMETTRFTLDGFSRKLSIFRKPLLNIQVSSKPENSKGYIHEDLYTSLITSHSFLPRMRNDSEKSCRKSHTALFIFNNFPPPKIVPFMRLCGRIL